MVAVPAEQGGGERKCRERELSFVSFRGSFSSPSFYNEQKSKHARKYKNEERERERETRAHSRAWMNGTEKKAQEDEEGKCIFYVQKREQKNSSHDAPPTATATITFALVHSAASTARASHGFVYAPNAPYDRAAAR